MNAKILLLLLAIVALIATATGCGGGSSSSSSEGQPSAAVTTSSLSQAAYVKKVNAACLQAKKNLLAEAAAYQKNASGPKVGPEYAANALKAVMLPIAEAQTAAIGEIGAPAVDKEKIEAIVAAQEKAIAEAKELKAVKTAADYEKLFAEASKELKKYGLTTCNLQLF